MTSVAFYPNNKNENLYLGPGNLNVPGMSHVMYAPGAFYEQSQAVYEAHKIQDKEGLIDNSLRCIQTPLNATHGALQISSNVLTIGTFFSWISKQVLCAAKISSYTTAGMGLILYSVELILETIGLYRATRFYNNFYPHERVIGSDQQELYRSYLTKIKNKYFQISYKRYLKIREAIQKKFPNVPPADTQLYLQQTLHTRLQTQKNNLVRRVQPWLANKIEKSIPQILGGLESTNPLTRKNAADKATLLFENIKIQMQKKWIVHIFTLLAISLLLAGLIAGLCTGSLVFLLTLGFVGTAFVWLRNGLYWGYIDSEGWNFSIENCIPTLFNQLIHI